MILIISKSFFERSLLLLMYFIVGLDVLLSFSF